MGGMELEGNPILGMQRMLRKHPVWVTLLKLLVGMGWG